MDRYQAIASLGDSIRLQRVAVEMTPEDDLDWPDTLFDLGALLNSRYLQSKSIEDLEEAIEIGKRVIDMTEDELTLAERLHNLGVWLSHKFQVTQAMNDLEEAINIGRKAINMLPHKHPDRAMSLSNIAIWIDARYSRTQTMDDLEEVIKFGRQSLDATPRHHIDRPERLFHLELWLGRRYLRSGSLCNLEETIQIGRQAIDETPAHNLNLPTRLSELGFWLSQKYFKVGAVDSLEEAIRIGRQAIEITPMSNTDLPSRLEELGYWLSERYLRIGVADDLDEAIQIGRKAIDATPEDAPSRGSRWNNLGTWLSRRYQRTGTMGDLKEAIQIGRQAVQAMANDHPDRMRCLDNLGVQLTNMYTRTGSLANLDEAIDIGRLVVDETPDDHFDRATCLGNLGARLNQRYSAIGATKDLTEAIQLGREAMKVASNDHQNAARLFSNMMTGLSDVYSKTGAMDALDEAIHLGQKAVEISPGDHPDRAGYLGVLGAAWSDKYIKTKAMEDLEKAMNCYHSALSQTQSPTLKRVLAGRLLMEYSTIVPDWERAYEASEAVTRLIPRLSPNSLENSDKQHVLSEISGLSSTGAMVAFQAGKGPLCALNLLEQGRAVLTASVDELRTDLVDLQENHPMLAEKFIHLRDTLEEPVSRKVHGEDQPSSASRSDQRHKVTKELGETITMIRNQDGFEDFMLPLNEIEMRNAASPGPIVVINVHLFRCDAILIEQGEIRSLALPKLEFTEIQNRVRESNFGSIETLGWLWDVVAEPILSSLHFNQPPPDNNWPRVWWIPTGPLSRFPLHAAGHHGRGSFETVLDRVASSYSSSVKAIIRSRKRPSAATSPIETLLVAMEKTPGHNSLPFAADEVETLTELLHGTEFNTAEPGQRVEDVMQQLPKSKIFHFAGHGHTDETDPSASNLLLVDGKMSVSMLLETNLHQTSPFLAYLSACGTGRVKEERFLDESIHLISGFQLAGFRHVIGTLWEVNDEICVDMARRTYECMREGGMVDESVCLGLHYATRELRGRWLDERTAGTEARQAQDCIGMTETTAGGQGRSARDVALCDDEDGEDHCRDAPLWVPYVHFGV